MELYKRGRIIIQDRASCFPATILASCFDDFHKTLPGGDGEDDERVVKLIDACSAPGNKTTHLTALAGCCKSSVPSTQHHRVAAFERDPRRSQILEKMVKTAGADTCVDVTTLDFTQSDPAAYQNVVGLVVDPSCSGSGIFGRGFVEADNDDDDENDGDTPEDADNDGGKRNENERLLKLAGFQFKIVKHALSFPAAQYVVYSTCSIHAIENEHVVERLLLDPDIKQRGWKVRPRAAVLPGWPRRGFENEFTGAVGTTVEERTKLAEGCVRAVAREDGGIGFFAVCFERKESEAHELPESQTHAHTLTRAQKKREKKKKQKQKQQDKDEKEQLQSEHEKEEEEDVEMDGESFEEDFDEEEWTGFD